MISIYTLHFVDMVDVTEHDDKKFHEAKIIAKRFDGKYTTNVSHVHPSGFCFKNKDQALLFIEAIKSQFNIRE